MTHKDRVLLRTGLLFVAVTSIVGITLLFIGRDFREPSTTFELLVFAMSSIALLLAIIQSITIERQMREIKQSSRRLSEAVRELDRLLATEKSQNKILKKDMLLDKELLEVLRDREHTH